jgi:hypothetical protein
MPEFKYTRGDEVFKVTAADEAAAQRIVQEAFSSDTYSGVPDTTPGDVGRGAASGAAGGLLNVIPGMGAAVADIATAPGTALYKGIDYLAPSLGPALGYEKGFAEGYKPGGFLGHSAASQEATQAVVDRYLIDPPVSKGGKLARAVTSAGVEALGGSGLFRVMATGQILNSADDAARAAQQAEAAIVAQKAQRGEQIATPKTRLGGLQDAQAPRAILEGGENIPMQVAAASAGGAGGELAPDLGLPPIVGALLASTGVSLSPAAVPAVKVGVKAIMDAPSNYLLRDEAAKQKAVEKLLRDAADDPKALRDWAERAQEAENAYQAENAKGPDSDPALLRRLDQARRESLGELVPGSQPTLYEAAGEDVGIGDLQRKATTQNTGGYAIELEKRRATQNEARVEELERLRGEGSQQDILTFFRRERDELDAADAAAEGTARTRAETAAQAAGTAQTPETIGEAIRTPVAAAQREVKREGNRLYGLIEDQGVTVGTGRLKAAVARAWRDVAENPLSGRERQVAELVRGYGGRVDFGLLRELRKDIASRARDTNLTDVERGRAKVLKKAIDDAMDDGLARAIGDDPNLFRPTPGAAPTGPPAGADVPFEGGGRVEPPIDDEVTRQYREANRHWREEVKEPYEAKPVKGIVADAPTPSGFKMTEGQVPEAAFRPGNTGGEQIRALREAGATNEALADAAALSLQRQAIRDGAVNPTAFRRWLHNHESAIRELPPEVQRRFLSANSAAEALAEATARRQANMRQFDESAVGKVLGIPLENLQKAIGTYLENPAASNELANRVARNPQAQAGLRRLVADHILRRFKDASDNLSKASLTKFISQNKGQIEAIFGKEGADRFQRLANDIERSRKQMTTGKDPAGPGTARDLWRAAGGDVSVMTLAASVFGPLGVGGVALAKHILGNMRLAGINGRDELFARALLNPDLARKLLTRAPALKNEKFAKGLGSTILRSAVAGAYYGGAH